MWTTPMRPPGGASAEFRQSKAPEVPNIAAPNLALITIVL
jgi:hypothetical protein